MTKIRNTKKGMAKKTLSISLAVAMLATSNVPVWAAEDLFTDGEVAVEAFTADEVVEEAPVVEEEEVNVAEAPVVTGTGYTATATDFANVVNNEVVWDNGSVTTDVTVTPKAANDTATLKAVWKDKNGQYGTPANLTAGEAKTCTISLTSDMVGNEYKLYVYAEKNGTIVWSWTSDAFTVKPVDLKDVVTSECFEWNEDVDFTYTGKAIVPTIDDISTSNEMPEGFTIDDFVIGNELKGDTVNVTEKGVTLYLSTTKKGYVGNVEWTYAIEPLELTADNINNFMEATYRVTSKQYTGKGITINKSELKLVDKVTGADLSAYIPGETNDTPVIGIGGNGADGSPNYAAGKEYDNLGFSVTESNFKENEPRNFSISSDLTIVPKNKFTIAKRDLQTVNVVVKEQAWDNDSTIVIDKANDVTYFDKTTEEELLLNDDVTFATFKGTVGKHSVAVTPITNNTNVENSVNATVSVASGSLIGATFTNQDYATAAEEFTGESIVKDKAKLGTVSDASGKPLEASEYEVKFGTNVNAGDDKGVIIIEGKGKYRGSTGFVYFDINPAVVDEDTVTVSKYVEKKDTTKAEDYKEAMNLVVKAKNADGKEFTLTEGVDYVAEYKFSEAGNEIGEDVIVTLKTTTGSLLKNKNFKAEDTEFTSEITKTILKDENIKLRKTSYTYTGTAIIPEFDVLVDGRVIPPTEYRVINATKNVNAGTATVYITGTEDGRFSTDVNAKATFTITAADASKLVGVMPSVVYTGYAIQPAKEEIHVTLDDVNIDVKENFDVTYGENVKIGDATIILTPKNDNFTGTKTITFKITGKMLNGGDLKFYDANELTITPAHAYDGKAYTAAKTVFDFENTSVNGGADGSAGKLTEGTDYEIKYVDNVYGKEVNGSQKGIVLVIAKGTYAGNYTGETVTDGIYTDADGNKIENVIYAESFDITQQTVAASNVTVSNGVYAGGLPVKPEVFIDVKGVTLVEGKDYDLDFTTDGVADSDRVNATASNSLKVRITFKNGYKAGGTMKDKSFDWGIDKFDLADAVVTVDGDKVTVKCGRVDVETSEYTVESKDGVVTVTANKDSKNYTGSKTVYARTEDQKPEKPMLVNVDVVGNKATAVLSGESEGAVGYDYVYGARDCIETKDYVKVNKNKLTTNTAFTYVQQGTYYAYCHAWKRDENGKKVFSDWSNPYIFTVTAVTPEKPAITDYKVNGNTVTVTYTKAKDADGYDVVLGTTYGTVADERRPLEYGELVKKNIKGNTVTATFKNVPKGTYYAGLHAFNRTSEDGKKVFSPWSDIKTIKVK